jgi:anti-sigma regulatory factor (Ser/Thr protein kinase)
MVILADNTISDVIDPIGDHHRYEVIIEFPGNLDLIGKSCEKDLWDLIYGGLNIWSQIGDHEEQYSQSLSLFSGSNWPKKLEGQIEEVYGKLIREIEDSPSQYIPCEDNGLMNFINEFGRTIGEAVANAVRHGNQRDNSKRVFIESYLGRNGIVWSVKDEGVGFDVKRKINLYEQGKWFHSSEGSGILFSTCHQSEMTFAYNSEGNQWMFRYDFNRGRYNPIERNIRR